MIVNFCGGNFFRWFEIFSMFLGEVYVWMLYLEMNLRLFYVEGICRIIVIILIFILILNYCEILFYFFFFEFSIVLFRIIVYFLCKWLVLIFWLDGEEVGNCMFLFFIILICDFGNFSFWVECICFFCYKFYRLELVCFRNI